MQVDTSNVLLEALAKGVASKNKYSLSILTRLVSNIEQDAIPDRHTGSRI